MDRTDIIAGIAACAAEVLRRPIPALTATTLLVDDLDLDSLSSLELLMAVETRLGVEFDPDQLELSAFPTVGSLADYVAQHRDVTV
jgi:acyl carrier protein